jgi:hypothetical protein
VRLTSSSSSGDFGPVSGPIAAARRTPAPRRSRKRSVASVSAIGHLFSSLRRRLWIVFIRFSSANPEHVSAAAHDLTVRLDIADLNFNWRNTNPKASFEPLQPPGECLRDHRLRPMFPCRTTPLRVREDIFLFDRRPDRPECPSAVRPSSPCRREGARILPGSARRRPHREPIEYQPWYTRIEAPFSGSRWRIQTAPQLDPADARSLSQPLVPLRGVRLSDSFKFRNASLDILDFDRLG